MVLFIVVFNLLFGTLLQVSYPTKGYKCLETEYFPAKENKKRFCKVLNFQRGQNMDTEQTGTKKFNRRGFLQIVAVAGAAAACWKLGIFGSTQTMQVARRSQPIMGTVLNLTVYGPDRDTCEEALNQTISTMKGLEGRLSRHMPDSELSELNRAAILENPSQDLLNVLTLAQDLSTRSNGAFDVTILPLLHLHEKIRGANNQPDQQQHAAARSLVNHQKLQINKRNVRLLEPGMGISLDGIGKGYIVDRGVAALRSLGFNNVYVEAGGDLMVSGRKEKNQPWRIGIRNPRPQQKQKLVSVAVSDKAVATSGDYMQAFTPDLKNHHIIDPNSGFSPPELASCTVTAPNVALADGLATALMVLGKDNGLDFIGGMEGCEAYLIDKNLQHFNTSGFFS
jgi:FAD:protein FMN transferase